jgi:hypothetical protein
MLPCVAECVLLGKPGPDADLFGRDEYLHVRRGGERRGVDGVTAGTDNADIGHGWHRDPDLDVRQRPAIGVVGGQYGPTASRVNTKPIKSHPPTSVHDLSRHAAAVRSNLSLL